MTVINRLTFERGTVRIYRVDSKNASYNDNAGEDVIPTETFENIDTRSFAWQDGYIPPYGIKYVEASDGKGLSELIPYKVADVIRINRYYPERGSNSSFHSSACTTLLR